MLWKFSSLTKLLRVAAWFARLTATKKSISLSTAELDDALLAVIRLAQRQYFSEMVLDKIKTDGFEVALQH